MTRAGPGDPRRKVGRTVSPRIDKARDRARQRKIVTNTSDKASRRNAPRIKAGANRTARHGIDAALRDDPMSVGQADIRIAQSRRLRHWGSVNAAAARARGGAGVAGRDAVG